jgi:hypothetical protein
MLNVRTSLHTEIQRLNRYARQGHFTKNNIVLFMALPLQSWFFIAIGAPGGDSDGNKRNIDTSGNLSRLTNQKRVEEGLFPTKIQRVTHL